MGFFNIVVSDKTTYLFKRNNQLVLNFENGDERAVNIVDINSVVFDGNTLKISLKALTALSEAGVAVCLCNEKHLPCATVLSFNNHFKQLGVFKLQNEVAKPLKKQLWKTIIQQKIENQARCLDFLGVSGDSLRRCANEVQSGDVTNRESTAAAAYFKNLRGNRFSRGSECFFNSAINYGYALIRTQIARTIALSGLQPFLGLHHCNELNAFNLADDLIEPLRPFVDLFVSIKFDDEQDELCPSTKKTLQQLLNIEIEIDDEKHSLPNAIQKMVESLILSFKNKNVDLKLPTLKKISKYKYE